MAKAKKDGLKSDKRQLFRASKDSYGFQGRHWVKGNVVEIQEGQDLPPASQFSVTDAAKKKPLPRTGVDLPLPPSKQPGKANPGRDDGDQSDGSTGEPEE